MFDDLLELLLSLFFVFWDWGFYSFFFSFRFGRLNGSARIDLDPLI